jgi:ADP-heptose:LPS heptosyltransferase
MSGGSARAVLALRALGLGDLLTAVPALRALRRWSEERHPGAELVLACPRALEPLLALAPVRRPYAGSGAATEPPKPLVDRVLDLDAKDPARLGDLEAAWRELSTQPPLVAVNLHGSGPASHRALAALAPGDLVGFACAEAGIAGPPWQRPGDPEEHETSRWCRLVGTGLGTDVDPHDLRLDRPAAAPLVRGAVVLHPGAAYPSRRWPTSRWARVAREVAEAGAHVVVTGGPEEGALAEQVRSAAGLPRDAVLAGRTDLDQLAAVVAAARIVVCGDTGTAHLASAYRTPSVVLFGPTSPARWGPPGSGPHTVLWHGTGVGAGDPRGSQPDPTLLRVSVEEVVAAVGARLAVAPGRAVRPADARTTPSSV